MLIGNRFTQFPKNNGLFIDSSKLKTYIKRKNNGETAYIEVTQFKNNIIEYPVSYQIVFQLLADINKDRKMFSTDITPIDPSNNYRGISQMWIIAGGYRFGMNAEDFTEYNAAGGSYDCRKLNIPTSLNKTNFVADAREGTVKINDVNVRDLSTISPKIPDQKYYISVPRGSCKINKIEAFGKKQHDWGQAHAKIYTIRLFDKNMNPISLLTPTEKNGEAGYIDECTGLFWGKTGLNGTFEIGSDNNL